MNYEEQAKKLLSELTLDEKLRQLTSQIVFDIDDKYEERRDPLCGNYRNPGHFMHQRGTVSKPSEVENWKSLYTCTAISALRRRGSLSGR